MTVSIERNRINATTNEVLCKTECNWKDYLREISGLPIAMRQNGVYLALAYALEREAKDGPPKENLGPAGLVIRDLMTIEASLFPAESQPPASENPRVKIGLWVHSLRDLGLGETAENAKARRYMARTECLYEIIGTQKRVAAQRKILADCEGASEDAQGSPHDA